MGAKPTTCCLGATSRRQQEADSGQDPVGFAEGARCAGSEMARTHKTVAARSRETACGPLLGRSHMPVTLSGQQYVIHRCLVPGSVLVWRRDVRYRSFLSASIGPLFISILAVVPVTWVAVFDTGRRGRNARKVLSIIFRRPRK